MFIYIFLTSLIIKEGVLVSRVSFIDIESIFLWKNLTFNDGMFHCSIGKDLNDISMQRLHEILIEVEMLSEKYNAFTSDFGEKQNKRWELIIDQRQKTEFLSFIKSQLSIFINIVDYMHKETINFEVERQSLDKKMATSAQFLIQYLINQSSILDQIYKLIFPSFTHLTSTFFQLILVDAEVSL